MGHHLGDSVAGPVAARAGPALLPGTGTVQRTVLDARGIQAAGVRGQPITQRRAGAPWRACALGGGGAFPRAGALPPPPAPPPRGPPARAPPLPPTAPTPGAPGL